MAAAQVIRYLRMIAVITPYAQFRFVYHAEDDRNSVRFSFVRRTDKMPAPPMVWRPCTCITLCESHAGVDNPHTVLFIKALSK